MPRVRRVAPQNASVTATTNAMAAYTPRSPTARRASARRPSARPVTMTAPMTRLSVVRMGTAPAMMGSPLAS